MSDFPESLLHALYFPLAKQQQQPLKLLLLTMQQSRPQQTYCYTKLKPLVAGSLPQCLPAIERAQKDLISSWELSNSAAAVRM